MDKNCETCAYQTSRWKVCTNKQKNAKVNQELLKEKGYCRDYIEKSVLFSDFKATRYMYDIFVSEIIEKESESAEEARKIIEKLEEEQAKKDLIKLREECTINGKFSYLELMRKCLSLGGFGKVINDSKRILESVAKS